MCTSPSMLPIGVIQGRDSDLQLSPGPTPPLLCAEYRAGAEHACASIHSADGGSVPEMQRAAPNDEFPDQTSNFRIYQGSVRHIGGRF